VSGSFWFPLGLSLRTSALTVALVFAPGTLLGYLLARGRFRGRALLDAAILLPLVLPPSVIGYLLLLTFGREGAIGSVLSKIFGGSIAFTFTAAVIAATVVALPLFVKAAQAALSQVSVDLEETAYTLGLSRTRTFFEVTLPLAWRGLVAAAVLTFARALGEFGATLIFAGNIQGRTNTMPLEIFGAYLAGDDRRALILVAILSGVSLVVVLVANRFGRATPVA
jgi:molybdate transport system permease protein